MSRDYEQAISKRGNTKINKVKQSNLISKQRNVN